MATSITTTSPNKIDDSGIEEADKNLIQGKRYLLVQDYVSAVSSLEEACQLFAQKYGESANECGEPYFYYGKALLELARMETGVLGNALEGVPNEEEDSDSDDDDSQVENPDNITEEEREKIKQDVDAAIDENSRDLEEKFQQLQEKTESETSAPTAKEDDTKMELVNSAPCGDTAEKIEEKKNDQEKSEVETMDTTDSNNDPLEDDVNETIEKMEETVEKKAENEEPIVEKECKVDAVLVPVRDGNDATTEKDVKETIEKMEETVEKKAEIEEKEGKVPVPVQDKSDATPEKDVAASMDEDAKESTTKMDDAVEITKELVETAAIASDEMKDEATVAEEKKKVETPVATNAAVDDNDMDESVEEGAEGEETNETPNDTHDKMNESGEAGPSGSNQEKEEDVSNLQLAWEVLELAKIIFTRQSETDKKMELKTAEVLLKLGEISIESENYKQAIDDLSECLRLQKCHLTPDDRAIAETFYQLGLAYSFYGQYEIAIENFHKSMQVIEERIATLQQSVSDSAGQTAETSAGVENPAEIAKREVEDLKSILPDIKSKVEDTEDMMKNSALALKEAALQRLQEDSSNASPLEPSTKDQVPSKPATNITHLLKRKRKSDGSVDATTEIDSKKKRAASGGHVSVSNGDGPQVIEGGIKNIESTA